MTTDDTERAKRFRERAREMRRLAEEVEPEHRDILLNLAKEYDEMAVKAEQAHRSGT